MNLFGLKKGSKLAALLQQQQGNDEDYGPTLDQLAATRTPDPYANLQQAPNFQEYMKRVLGPKIEAQPPQQQQPSESDVRLWPGQMSDRKLWPGISSSMPFMPPSQRMQKASGEMLKETAQTVAPAAEKGFNFLTKALSGEETGNPTPRLTTEDASKILSSGAQNAAPEDLPQQKESEEGPSQDFSDPNASAKGLMQEAGAAALDMAKKYGQAKTLADAKAALKREFEDTPELDAIIAKTEQELSNLKANRKQPGIGDFLVLALMNLGNPGNMRGNADMVLGLGDQKRDEMRLEDRLAQLEGGRASAKMQGRQTLRGMEQQEKYQALQNMMRQQEMGRKQSNEDREFGFKKEKLGQDKLMQELGQIRQQLQFETDPAKRKKLNDVIDRLDPYGNLRQSIQKSAAPPKDQRQSMMFGDLVGGGGYA